MSTEPHLDEGLRDLADEAGPAPAGLAAGARRRARITRRRRTAVLATVVVLAGALLTAATLVGGHRSRSVPVASPTPAPSASTVQPFGYLAEDGPTADVAAAWPGYQDVRVLYRAVLDGRTLVFATARRHGGALYMATFVDGSGIALQELTETPVPNRSGAMLFGFMAHDWQSGRLISVLFAPCDRGLLLRPMGQGSTVAAQPLGYGGRLVRPGVWQFSDQLPTSGTIEARCGTGPAPHAGTVGVMPEGPSAWGQTWVLMPRLPWTTVAPTPS